MSRTSGTTLAEPSAGPSHIALEARHLGKSYPAVAGSAGVTLFRDLNLALIPGECVAIVGQSGAGKSSLLHLLAGLDRPTAGQVWVDGIELSGLHPRESARLRNQKLGYVWQFHYLLPEFTAAENVAMPLLARGVRKPEAMAEAATSLDQVQLGTRDGHRTGELSGGEQQRVAIARALVTRPQVLLADEPTGDLDDTTAGQLFGLLQRLCREGGLAALIVTHNLDLARRCDRALQLREGSLAPLSGV